MARKGVHVRYDRRRGGGICVSADALSKLDPGTGKRSLKRPEDKLAFFSEIKADPKKTERFLQNGRDIGEIGDEVGFTFDQRRDLRLELFVDRRAVGGF